MTQNDTTVTITKTIGNDIVCSISWTELDENTIVIHDLWSLQVDLVEFWKMMSEAWEILSQHTGKKLLANISDHRLLNYLVTRKQFCVNNITLEKQL